MVKNLRFGTEELPIHAGRYRLVVSPLCPFCRRTTITRRLTGLSPAISVTYSTGGGPDGFIFETPGYSFNTEIRARSSRELYRRDSDWKAGDPTTVPLILDEKTDSRIVAHESDDIARDFVSVWRPFWKLGAPDLYPEADRADMDKFIAWVDEKIFGPLGNLFHGKWSETDAARLEPAFAELDRRGADQDYLYYADKPSYADVRIFSHLESALRVEAHLLDRYPHLKRFFDARWEDPDWANPQEKTALELSPRKVVEDPTTNEGEACSVSSHPTATGESCSL